MSGFSTALVIQKIPVLANVAAGTFTLPAGAALRRVYTRNTTANAVTGGLKFGTTLGGTDIVAALALAGNALADAAPLISAINATDRTIYFDAVAAWNSASVDLAVEITRVF